MVVGGERGGGGRGRDDKAWLQDGSKQTNQTYKNDVAISDKSVFGESSCRTNEFARIKKKFKNLVPGYHRMYPVVSKLLKIRL